MGQRNSTYITIRSTDKRTKPVFLPLYWQWNFISVQLPKLIRGFNYLFLLSKKKSLYDLYMKNYADAFYYQMQLSPDTFLRASENIAEVKEHGLYCEDNNNGWNFVDVTINPDTNKIVKIKQFNVLGGDGDDYKFKQLGIDPNKKFLPFNDYLKFDDEFWDVPQDENGIYLYELSTYNQKKYDKFIKSMNTNKLNMLNKISNSCPTQGECRAIEKDLNKLRKELVVL